MLDQIAKVDAFDELENDEVQALILAHVVHAGDVVVVQPGGALGLVLKSPQGLRIRAVPRQHLDRDRPPQPQVRAAEHRTHSAAADELLQPKMAQADAFQRVAQIGP